MIFHSYFPNIFSFSRTEGNFHINDTCVFILFLLSEFLPEEEMNPIVLVMYVIGKLIRQIRNSTLELDLTYELHTWEKNKRKY